MLKEAIQQVAKGAKEKGAAEAAKSEAEEKQKAAQADIAALKNGSLLSSGLTGGIALALQLPGPFNRDNAVQGGASVTTMPYVLVLPAMWWTPQATREACVASWGGGDEETSRSAALAVTRKRAGTVFKAIDSAITGRGGALDDAATTAIMYELSLTGYNKETAKAIIKAVNTNRGLSDEAKETHKSAVIDWMSYLEWKPALKERCWSKRIGVWVGYPANYDARTTVAVTEQTMGTDPTVTMETTRQDITTMFATGLGFSPNTYFSVLVGFTMGNVSQEATDTKKAVDSTIWSTTVAIGGNLDIIGSIMK